MKRLALLLFAPMVAYAQTCAYPPCYYNHSTINPLPPYYMGVSGIIPVVLNSYTISGAVTAGSTTFTCVSGCSSLKVGQGVTGSDGVNLIYPSVSGQLGTLITQISGTTITTSQASNVATVPGTYTLTIGKDRWDLNSTAVVNSIGTNHIWSGQAANGNSTWAQGYLSGDCDTGAKVTNCSLINSGASSEVLNFWGARTSDNTAASPIIENITLAVNDSPTSRTIWGNYWETILLDGAGTLNETHALESTTFNFNHVVKKVDPYLINNGGMIENLRIDCGQPGLGTMYNCTDAMSIIGINSTPFESGIVFATGSLDEVTLVHPPALALPAGPKGYGILWYEASGYSTPAWSLYSTNATRQGDYLSLNDDNVIFSMINDLGTGLVTMGPGSLKLSGNHTATFAGSASGFGLDVESATINDPVSSGAVSVAAINHFGVATLTSDSVTTIANAATVTITGCPVASTNVTITTCESLRVFGDEARFDGLLKGALGASIFGAATSINASSNFSTNINTGTNNTSLNLGGTTTGNVVNVATVNFRIGGVNYASVTAPTIASGFNTSGSSIVAASTASFPVTVGTGTGTSTGVLTMPSASHGWACSANDVTTPATHMIQQTASGTTSVTVTDFARTTGVAQNMANGDVIEFLCGAN